MGVLEWIASRAVHPLRTLEEAGGALWDSAKSVFHFAAGVFDKVGGAWDWVVNGISWLGDNLIGLAARLLHYTEWLVLHAIPEGLSWAFNQAVHAAAVALHAARHVLEAALHAAVKWVQGALHTLENWARAAVRDVWHTLTQAWHFIETVGKRVADLVLHPDKLAAWLIGHLVLPLVRFLLESSAPIVRWLLHAFEHEAHAFAAMLESVLAKII